MHEPICSMYVNGVKKSTYENRVLTPVGHHCF
jgi:hypothetical protein